jgi:hypothetical protein
MSNPFKIGDAVTGADESSCSRFKVIAADEVSFTLSGDFSGSKYGPYLWSDAKHFKPLTPAKPKPPAPPLTKEKLARAIFDTDPMIIGIVAHVGECGGQAPGYNNRREVILGKAWDRNESGRREVAERRAVLMLEVLGVSGK